MKTNQTLETVSKRIGEHDYNVTVFPGGRSLELLFELKTALGDSFGALFGQNAEGAITKMGGQLGKREIVDLVLRLLELTTVDGKPFDKATFDSHFAGRIGQLFKVLTFVVESNYSDFFDELRRSIIGFLKTFDDLMRSGARTAGAVT